MQIPDGGFGGLGSKAISVRFELLEGRGFTDGQASGTFA